MREYLQNLSSETGIPFVFYTDEKLIYGLEVLNKNEMENDFKEHRFNVENSEFKILIPEKFESSIPVMEFCIKEKIKSRISKKEQLIAKLLSGSNVYEEDFKEEFGELKKNNYFMVIEINKGINEALNAIKSIYAKTETELFKINNCILLLGRVNNIEEHAESIYETISTDIDKNCFIAYKKIEKYIEIKDAYEQCRKKISLGIKYGSSERIFNSGSLIFESFIENINENEKEKIFKTFDEGFLKLDKDMRESIDVFFKVNLNVSDAAKQLYVHRNTLIYRLDKIQKYTSYDIRKFNDAVVFKTAYEIWKQKNSNIYRKIEKK